MPAPPHVDGGWKALGLGSFPWGEADEFVATENVDLYDKADGSTGWVCPFPRARTLPPLSSAPGAQARLPLFSAARSPPSRASESPIIPAPLYRPPPPPRAASRPSSPPGSTCACHAPPRPAWPLRPRRRWRSSWLPTGTLPGSFLSRGPGSPPRPRPGPAPHPSTRLPSRPGSPPSWPSWPRPAESRTGTCGVARWPPTTTARG